MSAIDAVGQEVQIGDLIAWGSNSGGLRLGRVYRIEGLKSVRAFRVTRERTGDRIWQWFKGGHASPVGGFVKVPDHDTSIPALEDLKSV